MRKILDSYTLRLYIVSMLRKIQVVKILQINRR